MQPALKLTTDQPLNVPPEELFKHLARSVHTLDDLIAHFKCSPEDLYQTLHDQSTSELLRLKVQLASLQLKLLAVQYLPHAFFRLLELMKETEKPEVARRAANTVLHLAGVSTQTKSQEPTPPPEPDVKPDENAEVDPAFLRAQEERPAIWKTVGTLLEFERRGLSLYNLPESHYPAFLQTITNFALDQNLPDLFTPNPRSDLYAGPTPNPPPEENP